MMMMIIFNGRRPVPITRVLNIPCWNKSRQVVRPGLQYLLYIDSSNTGKYTLRRIYIAAVVKEVGR